MRLPVLLVRLVSLLFIQILAGSVLLLNPGLAQSEPSIFLLQKGTPVALQNFIQTDKGCNWSGIGGQVFDRNKTPFTGLVIKLTGVLENQNILYYAVTGGSLPFGPGGYLIELTDHPVASKNTATIQVLDLTGAAKSAPIPLVTYGDCARNLLLVNIFELPIQNPIFLPFIRK